MATTSRTGELTPNKDGVVVLQERARAPESLLRTAVRRILHDPLTLGAIIFLLVLAALSFGAPIITNALGVDPNRTAPLEKFHPIGYDKHILGTDELGRDHLARLLYGGQVSLTIGFAAALMTTAIGVTLGLIAGYNVGGRFAIFDDIIMWVITTLSSIPDLMLLILIASAFREGVSVSLMIFILAILSWTGTMRLIRGETLAYREREFVVSARALGAGPLRVMFAHILPNTISVLVTTLAIAIGGLMLTEAGLSFLGLGVRPPTPTWGNMLNGAQGFFRPAPHLVIFPGLLIASTVLSLYLLGDGLRDAFDPTSRK